MTWIFGRGRRARTTLWPSCGSQSFFVPWSARNFDRCAISPSLISPQATVRLNARHAPRASVKLYKQKRKRHHVSDVLGRGRRARTLGTRFWRPLLYQLSYTPIYVVLQSTTILYTLFIFCQCVLSNISLQILKTSPIFCQGCFVRLIIF